MNILNFLFTFEKPKITCKNYIQSTHKKATSKNSKSIEKKLLQLWAAFDIQFWWKYIFIKYWSYFENRVFTSNFLIFIDFLLRVTIGTFSQAFLAQGLICGNDGD